MVIRIRYKIKKPQNTVILLVDLELTLDKAKEFSQSTMKECSLRRADSALTLGTQSKSKVDISLMAHQAGVMKDDQFL